MIALALSGGKDSMACLHLLRAELDVAIYVDTGFAYPETTAMVDYAETLLPVVRVRADRASQNARFGIPSDVVPVDWTVPGQQLTSLKPVTVQSYVNCCYDNIAAPLNAKAMAMGVKVMVCGQRNTEGHRATSKDGDVVDGIVRCQPIETWTDAEVFDYLATVMDVPPHFAIKHSSLDCYDCTGYRKESHDRVAWTMQKHPTFYAAYVERRELLDRSLSEALYA